MTSTTRRQYYIAMDITDRCNLRCAMCVRTASPKAPGPDLTVEQFRTIGDHCFDHAVVLALSCVSEPLLSKHFSEIMATLKDYRVPSIELVTNGMLLDEPKIAAMLDSQLSRIIFSIDGATAATYESIREGANFERLLSNLQLLQRMKAERGLSRPLVRFNFVMMRRNIEELPGLIQLAVELGALQVTAQHMTIYEGAGSEGESLFAYQDLTNRMLLEAHRLAARHRITFDAPPLFSAGTRSAAESRWLLESRLVTGMGVVRDFGTARLFSLSWNLLRRKLAHRRVWCHHPWEIVFLDPQANVRPCVNWGTEPVLGNCLEQSLDEILDGPAYTQLREELSGRASKRGVCLHCPAVASGKVDEATAFEERPG
jgi:MoaA/NifB/PqqE/SkfB family radical SAM enzyme